ncbi:hypothetical protein [Paraburkholderia sp. RL17-347-BIC-D]|uniref:hypothetical protein n=1 Tax=Paraburkholderia sp. RL17-347-BIC-D TaxID=3031632 RepID=UPI0038BAA5A6
MSRNTRTQTSDHEDLGSPYGNMLTAANDQYHAVCSINKHGPGKHQRALEQVYLEQGITNDPWEAMNMANWEVNKTRRVQAGEQTNRKARQVLDAKERKLKKQSDKGVVDPHIQAPGKLSPQVLPALE